MTHEEVTTLKEAIKRLKEVIKEVRSIIQPFLYDNEAKDYILKALEQPNWIPVSERLPKNDEDVLVCYQQGGMEVVYYHKDDTYYPTQYANLNETGWYNENGDALYFEPIAWMPLPEPMKVGEENC